MIDPFEYEKTKSQVKLSDSAVKNDALDTSALDKPLRKLNNFHTTSEHEMFRKKEAPYTVTFQKEVGRVAQMENNKSDFQGEDIGRLGSMVSEYETVGSVDVMNRENASVLIHRYLDKEVGFVPTMKETVNSVTNIKSSDPVLQPGITFIDSRKNMATHF